MNAEEFLEDKGINSTHHISVLNDDGTWRHVSIKDMLEEYHQTKLKLLGIGAVSARFDKQQSHEVRKLLTDFYLWMQENDYDHNIPIRVENKAELFLRERNVR